MKARIGVLVASMFALVSCGKGPTQPDTRVDPVPSPVPTVSQGVTPRPTTTPVAVQPTPCRIQKYCSGVM